MLESYDFDNLFLFLDPVIKSTTSGKTGGLQFGHFETVEPGEILDFSLGKTFLFFCWPRSFVRCSDVQKWSHYMFRVVR